MEIRQPEWHLRAPCPVCEQGGLLIVVCPECSHVAAICAEEGSAFANAKQIGTAVAVNPQSAHCPTCHGPSLVEFRVATSDEIQRAGLRSSEYE
jgi:hypothetical protein